MRPRWPTSTPSRLGVVTLSTERFSEEEIRRYARHIVLPEIGGSGQERLRESRVLVVGLGGLGSPVALYLAAAGVGTLGLVDHDRVDLSNLQRQVIHSTESLGTPKTESARDRLAALNPGVKMDLHETMLGQNNALQLVEGYDVVVGGVDNFDARYCLNDACVLAGIPLVEAGVLRFEGMVMTVIPRCGPCYRCLFPTPPRGNAVPTCAEAGVVGALPGIMGTLQAMEVIKLLLGIGRPLSGRLLMFDALSASFQEVAVDRDPGCPVCGDNPTITVPGEDIDEPAADCPL